MIRGFYSGVSGAIAQSRAIDVIANNVANVNTAGYKSQKAEFSELVYTNLMTPAGNAPQNLKQGSGTRISAAALDLTQGILQTTNRPLDVALTGEGFFAVMDAAGNISYTRQGAFQLSLMQDGNIALVTAGGDRVLDADMQPITIPKDTETLVFSGPGKKTDDTIQLGIVNFANPYALQKLGDSRFAATENSGEAVVTESANLMQGALENSSVDLAEEMTGLIIAQRGFQLSSRVIQTADEIEQITNSLR